MLGGSLSFKQKGGIVVLFLKWWKFTRKYMALGICRDDFGEKESGVEDIQDARIRVHIEAFDFEKIIDGIVVIFDR